MVTHFARVVPNGLRVVLYHHVADTGHDLVDGLQIETPIDLFEAHIRRLARDYQVIGLDEVLSGNMPDRALLITFDDGYRSVVDEALPVLQKLGLPSVFFVSEAFLAAGSVPTDNLLSWLVARHGAARVAEAITDHPASEATIGHIFESVAQLPYERVIALRDELSAAFDVDQAALRHESNLFLDPVDLPRLSALGCEVGNHTRSHVFCRCIVTADVAHEELAEAKRRLEAWSGSRVRSFSYPYGYKTDATTFVERALAGSGHQATFLVESRTNLRHRPGTPWNRVSLHDRPVGRLATEIEILPHLRAVKDRVRPSAPSS